MLLQQYDRCSMQHSIECRMPFMDYRIIEFVFSLPNQSRIGGGFTKRILRDAMKNILPEETRTRRIKLGFHPPEVDWYLGPLKEWSLSLMNQRSFLENEYFDGKQLRHEFNLLINGHYQDPWNHTGKFWGPLHTMQWMAHHQLNF